MAKQKSSEERLKELQQRAAKIEQEKSAILAKQRADEKTRKNRQKLLYGVVVMSDPELREIVDRVADTYLTRPSDRAALGLPVRVNTTAEIASLADGVVGEGVGANDGFFGDERGENGVLGGA